MTEIVPVILSGGAGSRLWPLSRELHPKQFLPLVGERSMLQETALRLGETGAAPLVVCNEAHRFMVAEQLREVAVRPRAVVLEPAGRNTAPAVALAALAAQEGGADPLLLVLPSDHLVRDAAALRAAVEAGAAHAAAGALVTFGIVPDAAETGYGYIRAGAPLDGGAFRVARFVEKPDRATAERFLAEGGYYWNSGMFLFRAGRYLEELARHAPAILEACRGAWAGRAEDADFVRPDRGAFEACPSDSVDYAVMERTEAAVVQPLDAGWSDVGSWSALWQAREQDEAGNVVLGDVLAEDVRGSYLHATSRIVAAVGLEGHVVVETADAVLVAPRERVQDVKALVARLKAEGREEALLHRRVYRPWGSYETVDRAERFQVKRITVNPGASLSLQMHHHRAEHWVVVRGTARVTRGEESFLLTENQSTYIPVGVRHRLENPGKIPLELIEVQSGPYLGEDDIVRFEDRYGR
ncbi:mannose-1-phosphate guanylyltransferase/mannose-6-phosphate isomerase [Inmirania thermothiophila]|uniref:mannose-1-phosphate guanylyltransferase n=1 Tax=Inmirania thermothiophila TaxID=1750597 RepID=A0A3N1XSN9_9GAMM|nr:mannose-1-phosphate guanylyltransferase/mannose-6-phosphate isomerase [Inmirania thermothiophila]ROR29659.1 mannose-1-phosphate guanylyltransferase (GDP) /mannose-6-phosphate isomerase type 2 [Inmirania thermothiophila]